MVVLQCLSHLGKRQEMGGGRVFLSRGTARAEEGTLSDFLPRGPGISGTNRVFDSGSSVLSAPPFDCPGANHSEPQRPAPVPTPRPAAKAAVTGSAPGPQGKRPSENVPAFLPIAGQSL